MAKRDSQAAYVRYPSCEPILRPYGDYKKRLINFLAPTFE